MSGRSPGAVVEQPLVDHPAARKAGLPALWACAWGVGAAALVVVLLLAVATPWLSTVLAVVLLGLAPSSSRLDRRLALNLALVVGWAPVALLLPPLLGPRTAAVTTLAVAVGATVAVVAAGRGRLVPSMQRRDATILVGGLLAALIALPLRSTGSPQRALAMLSTGIDHAFQYAMYLDRRLLPGAPAFASGADNSGFSNYPKWFHSLLTVVSQTVFGEVGRPAAELERYAAVEWVVFIVITVLVTAALLQALPGRTSAVFLVPGLAVTWSLTLGIPGSLNLLQGHLGFLLAACAPSVIFLLAVPGNRLRPVTGVAIAGLVVLATSWTLLLPFALVTAAWPTWVVWRRQRAAVRWSLAALAAAVVAAACVFVVPLVLSPALQDLVRDGTIPRVSLPVLLVLLVAPVLWFAARLWRHGRAPDLVPHLLVSVAAAGQLAVLAAYMLASTGELTYYFYKLGLASLLATSLVTVHAVAVVFDRPGEVVEGRRATRRRFTALAVCLAALLGLGAALQQFAAPSAAWAAILPSSLSGRAASGAAGDVGTVLDLAADMPPAEAEHTVLIATLPGDMHAGHASVWFHAVSLSTSARAMSTNDLMYELAEDRTDTARAVDIARRSLAAPDVTLLVTDPAVYRAVLASGAPADPSRVRLLSR